MTLHFKIRYRQLTQKHKVINEGNRKRRWFGHLIPGWASGHVPGASPTGLRVHVYHPQGKFNLWILALILSAAGAVAFEINTSKLQSRILSFYSGKLTYEVKAGPSPSIVFPKDGPFDIRRGYTFIPDFQDRLAKKGFAVVNQASFSEELAKLANWGVTPPDREPDDVGLMLKSADGKMLFDATAGDHLFASYQSVPPVLVDSLLYMENRELGDGSHSAEDNPVIDWPRLAKAAATFAGRKIGLPVRLEGGSTLATQLEKFQHSPFGQTESGMEKLRQMLAASLSVYKQGRDTRAARQEIILDYLNTIPLASVPGYGEVNGLGNGLYAWFGLNLDSVCKELQDKNAPAAEARALKYSLALLAAVREPSYYLNGHLDRLESRLRYYSAMLAKAGIITPELAARMTNVKIALSPHPREGLDTSSPEHKEAGNLSVHLAQLLGVPSMYDLNRLHLEADTTLDSGLQKDVLRVFEQLRNPDYVRSNGLYGDRLLSPNNDLNKIVYSFILFERQPEGNALRAEVDNLNAPFDINEGVKLQLGSTAKLRVLAHYLELMDGLYREYSKLDGAPLAAQLRQAPDPLTLWAAQTLSADPGLRLDDFLAKSLDRTYSADPDEVFFTGSGAHVFHNFDPNDNTRILTIREATQRSVNLVFIRLMRDIVRYHEARLPYNPDAVLSNPDDPMRRTLLEQIADDESKERLNQFYQKYRGLTQPEALSVLLGPDVAEDRWLTIVYFAWYPEARTDDAAPNLARWLAERGVADSPAQVQKLVKAYGNPRLTISDYGYLLENHPLEVWVAGQIARAPGLSLHDLIVRSSEARKEASAWLFQTRNRSAQDLRLRIRFEEDAFKRMTPYWQRLGFPFDHLVPSLATAIGSSSDRPAALAKLMGIIQNDGVLCPGVRFETLRFAENTPYETVLAGTSAPSEQVMDKAVARLLRQVLGEVVTKGTAARDADAFLGPDGKPIAFGGKTGSGDNRFVEEGRGGVRLESTAVNRTATFVFYLGDRYFGTITAFVNGKAAADYQFTSAFPLGVLKALAPAIKSHLFPPATVRLDKREASPGSRG